MNVSQILDAAADKIEQDGHCKGIYFGPNGDCCAYGAIRYAETGKHSLSGMVDFTGATNVFHRALGMSIFDWNDRPERTADEVIAMLRAVAMTERAREARLLPVVQEPRVFTLHEQVTA